MLHDAGTELGTQVDREVRHAQPVHERAGAANSLSRAAAELAVAFGVRPQLERHPHRLRALPRHEQRCDRAVDAPTHGDEHAPLGHPQPRLRACGGAQRAVERVSRELGRVALGCAQSAELSGDRIGVDAGRVKQRRAAHVANGGAARGEERAAPAAVEARVVDPPLGAVAVDRHGHADQIPAGGSTGGAGEGVRRTVSAPVRVFDLRGPGSIRSRLEHAGARGFSRFVGRESELARLERALREARAGRPSVGLALARVADRLLDRVRVRQAGHRRGLAVWQDDQDRRRLVDLHRAREGAE